MSKKVVLISIAMLLIICVSFIMAMSVGTAGWYFKGERGAARIRDLFHHVSTYEEMEQAVSKAIQLTQAL